VKSNRPVLGIMQGRLSPRYEGRYQAFPVHTWEAEFFIAADMGFDCIEFIIDEHSSLLNPLLDPDGRTLVSRVIEESEVTVRSICADCFMEVPFHSRHIQRAKALLTEILSVSSLLGIVDVVIPCVDQSSLKSDLEQEQFIEALSGFQEQARDSGVRFSLETDLGPKEFSSLLDKFPSEFPVSVNYDIGNSASLGFNPKEELMAYGSRISDVHIKDRNLGGASVELGTGDADFKTVVLNLQKAGYEGPWIMQAARGNKYTEDIAIVDSQREWFLSLWEDCLHG
jgi:L-ribulose-5-phosphate 3-epimerase